MSNTVFQAGQILYAANLNAGFEETVTSINSALSGNVTVNGSIFISNTTSSTLVVSNNSITVTGTKGNVVVSNAQVTVSNSSVNVGITIPTSAQQGFRNTFLHANGQWANVGSDTYSTTNTQILFNSSNTITGSNSLTFGSNTLSTNSISVSGTINVGSASINSTSYTGTANNATYAFGKSEGGLNVNSAVVSNSAVYLDGKLEAQLSVNTALTANNSNNLGGVNASSYATITYANNQANAAYVNAITFANNLILDSISNTSITRVAAANSVKTAYDVAIAANTRAASAQTMAANAFSNATAYTNTFASNADNITSGTVGYARLGVNIVNTTANFTFTDITHTYAGNSQLVLSGQTSLVANGTNGSNGYVLKTNGDTVFWGDPSVGVAFANGISITVNNFVLTGAFTANSSNGTAGQILFSNGSAVYWDNVVPGFTVVNTAADITWTGVNSFQANLNANAVFATNVKAGVITAQTGTQKVDLFVDAAAGAELAYLGANGLTIGTLNSAPLALEANNTPYLIIAANGNIGIGQSYVSPPSTLSVSGNLFVASDVTISGNLVVSGNIVSVNTQTLDVVDKNITVAKGSANAAAANGAGITVDGANVAITYISASNAFSINSTGLIVTGNASLSRIVANSSLGTAGQVLTSNGTTTYWSTISTNTITVNTSVSANLLFSNSGGLKQANSTSALNLFGADGQNYQEIDIYGQLSSNQLTTNSYSYNTILSRFLGENNDPEFILRVNRSSNNTTTTKGNIVFEHAKDGEATQTFATFAGNSVQNFLRLPNTAIYVIGQSTNNQLTTNTAAHQGLISIQDPRTTGATVGRGGGIVLASIHAGNSAYRALGGVKGSLNYSNSSSINSEDLELYAANGFVRLHSTTPTTGSNNSPVLTVGANTTGNSIVIGSNTRIYANGSTGSTGEALLAGGAGEAYWGSPSLVTTGTTTNTFTIGTASYFVSNGNFGIANNNPTNKLHVTGTAFVSGNLSIGGIASVTGNASITGDTTTGNTITVGTAAFFVANGNFGIANSSPTNKLHVTGSEFISGNSQIGSLGVGTAASGTTGEIRATNDITAFYSSDQRLKDNIKPIENALDKIRQIQGVMFDWNDEYINSRGGEDGYFVRKHDTGVIAQSVEKVIPELVAQREDGYLAVKYDKMAGLIIQAINELAEQIDDIKKKLD